MPGWRVSIAMVVAMTLQNSAATEDVLSGASLARDVARYASFGLHRFGSPGDRATTDWIARELQAAGFRVEFQPVVLGRQYAVERATAEVGGARASYGSTRGAAADGTATGSAPERAAQSGVAQPGHGYSQEQAAAHLAPRRGLVSGLVLTLHLPTAHLAARFPTLQHRRRRRQPNDRFSRQSDLLDRAERERMPSTTEHAAVARSEPRGEPARAAVPRVDRLLLWFGAQPPPRCWRRLGP